MPKTRMIIADPDYEYLLQLQLLFLEHYLNEIEIEIIDDYSYFNVLFSSPQIANVLIISKDWYSREILRHNIDSILVLSNDNAKEEYEQITVYTINRASGIDAVFNQIVEACSFLSIEEENYSSNHKPKMIVLYSPRGGTGVTTIALAISSNLAKKNKRVLYIEAARINSFQCHINDIEFISSPLAISKLGMENITYGDVKEIIRKDGFCYFPPFKTATVSYGIKYSLFRKIASSARDSGEYDYIIVDSDSTFDEDKVELLEIADVVIIPVEPNATSIYSATVLTGCISGILSDDKYIFIGSKISDDSKFANEMSKLGISESVPFYKDFNNSSINSIASSQSIKNIMNLIDGRKYGKK